MLRNESSSSLNSGEHSGDGAPSAALKKGPWTAAEDAMLVEYVKKHGEGNWNSVQKKSGLSRCGKSCRLRWANHLRPNLKKGSFTPEEEMLILHLHSQLGNKWARMAAQLPGRTDNEIKNYWNTRIKRRQRAGLPLYPTEVQLQQQQQRRMGSLRPQPLIVPSHPAHSAPNSPLSHSPLPLFNQTFPVLMQMSNSMPEMPRVKRIRDDGLTFQFPLSPTTTAVSPHMNQTGTTAGMMGMFQYGYENQRSYNELSYGLKTELPSNQFYNGVGVCGGGGGDSGCGLLDAMLHEYPHAVGDGQRDMFFSDHLCGSGDQRKDLFLHSQCENGISRKREQQETQAQDDISKLFDMITTPATTVTIPEASECFNNNTCEDMSNSNGGQSSMVTDDELGVELQHLVSSLSVPSVDQEFNIGSCPWNNMPGIC